MSKLKKRDAVKIETNSVWYVLEAWRDHVVIGNAPTAQKSTFVFLVPINVLSKIRLEEH